jgi:hypothetical protein
MAVGARLLAPGHGACALNDRTWSRWLVHAHHPELRRSPEPSPGRIQEDHARAALTWNTFRTLALIQPSFWLRQLHARMFGFDERYRAPTALDVRLWEPATFSGAGGTRTEPVDVVLDSPEAVWGFLTVFGRDVIVTRADAEGPDPVRRTIDAVAGIAGGRRCFVGMVASSEATAPMGTRLIRRHAEEVRSGGLRDEPHRRHVLGVGLGNWGTVATVLAGAASTPAIEPPERLALQRCLRWLAAGGVMPRDS